MHFELEAPFFPNTKLGFPLFLKQMQKIKNWSIYAFMCGSCMHAANDGWTDKRLDELTAGIQNHNSQRLTYKKNRYLSLRQAKASTSTTNTDSSKKNTGEQKIQHRQPDLTTQQPPNNAFCNRLIPVYEIFVDIFIAYTDDRTDRQTNWLIVEQLVRPAVRHQLKNKN